MEQAAVPVPAQVQTAPRRWWIAVVVLVGALIVVGGALAATKIFAATRATFADSMPPDTVAFFHVDLLNLLRSSELDRMLEAFQAENELGDPIEDAVSEIDRLLLEETKFDLTNDIVPWMGRGVGLGVSTLGLAGDEAEFITAIDVRDSGKFREFFPKLQATIEESDGPLVESEYEGVTIYTAGDGAFALSKAVFLIGSSSFAVRDAIDAQLGESLADSPDFEATLDRLPANRVFTGWIDASAYTDELAGLGTLSGGGLIEPGLFNSDDFPMSYGFSGRFVDAGVRFDFVAIYPEDSDFLDPWRDGRLNTAELAPDSTLGFLAVPPFVEQYTDLLREELAEEYDDARSQVFEGFGIDLEADLLALLDGEFGFVVTRETGGLMDREFEIPLGFAAFLGTSEQDHLRSTLTQFVDDSRDSIDILGPFGDPELYEVTGTFEGANIPFGVDYGYLMVATERRTLEDIFRDSDNKLVDDPTFKNAASELHDMELVFYVDMLKVYNLLESQDETVPDEVRALESMLAGERVDGNVLLAAFVIAIDY